MKIRSVALGVVLTSQDFVDVADQSPLQVKLAAVADHLRAIQEKLTTETGYEVQTLRIYCNSFEEWLLPLFVAPFNMTLESIVLKLTKTLESIDIQLCSIGNCQSDEAIVLVPKILSLSARLSCSVLFRREEPESVCPDYAKLLLAAKACLDVAEQLGDLGNFRFCTSFHCPDGIPFFPAAYRKAHFDESDRKHILTIGLESGDAVHQAYYGVPESCHTSAPQKQAREALREILRKVCLSIQGSALAVCEERGILYGGIDASINPGLAEIDSVGAGLEALLPPVAPGQERLHSFGAMGTLAAVSTTTIAVKSLINSTSTVPGSVFHNGYQFCDATADPSLTVFSDHVKLVGYSGLMLPVMEDVVLAKRASEARYTLRDLLTFSAVCGVGLDTVPIPGDTTPEALAAVYQEVATLAFRLNKPLSCRVLPMHGKTVGDLTDVVSPYLCNTTVFAV